MRLIMLFFAILSLASTNVHATEAVADYFQKYRWIENGVDFLKSRSLELAPVTSCKKLNAMFAEDDLTAIQKKREWEAYDDKLIPLTGVVQEVAEIPLSDDFLAIFKCSGSKSFVSDFTVRIPAHKSDLAYEMNVGEKRRVYVRLKDYSSRSGIETEMDYGSFAGGLDGCKPTLARIARSNGEIVYGCNDNDYLVRKIDVDMGEGTLERFYLVDLRETGDTDKNLVIYASGPVLKGESLYLHVNSQKEVIGHVSSAGSCVFENEKDLESPLSVLSDKDKERVASIRRMKNPTGREAINNYLQFKKDLTASNSDYSCEVRQLMHWVAIRNVFVLAK
ncbi:hypothetical protein QQF73_10505 [Marinobacter sp. M216]|uniref:Uncharacterized protein n=1 Tax=Marinobacter albus TaxID=3030833 RepID=A0ABT7HCE0_9GAMM|nr:hypothetical protein [Marinobacter sp. M216]MDK9558053.1 hypothetical protein [Marinobacter sp. M216]